VIVRAEQRRHLRRVRRAASVLEQQCVKQPRACRGIELEVLREPHADLAGAHGVPRRLALRDIKRIRQRADHPRERDLQGSAAHATSIARRSQTSRAAPIQAPAPSQRTGDFHLVRCPPVEESLHLSRRAVVSAEAVRTLARDDQRDSETRRARRRPSRIAAVSRILPLSSTAPCRSTDGWVCPGRTRRPKKHRGPCRSARRRSCGARSGR
jgi:hypothetical protein